MSRLFADQTRRVFRRDNGAKQGLLHIRATAPVSPNAVPARANREGWFFCTVVAHKILRATLSADFPDDPHTFTGYPYIMTACAGNGKALDSNFHLRAQSRAPKEYPDCTRPNMTLPAQIGPEQDQTALPRAPPRNAEYIPSGRGFPFSLQNRA